MGKNAYNKRMWTNVSVSIPQDDGSSIEIASSEFVTVISSGDDVLKTKFHIENKSKLSDKSILSKKCNFAFAFSGGQKFVFEGKAKVTKEIIIISVLSDLKFNF